MACLLSVCERKEGRKEGNRIFDQQFYTKSIQNERKLFQMEEKYFRKK
jgi:hypothetical protein